MTSTLNYKIIYFSFLSLLISDYVLAEEKKPETTLPVNENISGLNLNIDKSKWKCKYCPDNEDEPWFLEVETGVGYVTNESYKFGEYNGLHEKGPFLILDVDAMYRDENANYFDIKADNLGLDTRRLEMEGGTQGKYKVNVLIDNITKYNLDTAQTPYSGTTNQTLSTGWVQGATTVGMTNLAAELRKINYYTKRQNLKISSNYIQNAKWNYDIKFSRQTKEGKTPFAAAIGVTFADAKSAVLAKPVDYSTENIEFAANYNHKKMSGTISVIHSSFKNKNDSVTWDNAFSTGPNSGQISLEPDNEMQQLMANGQYRGYDNIIISGLLSVAQMKQNESFLPYTNNTALTPAALPLNGLAGKVNVYNANANVNWTVNQKSKVKFSYEHQEQSNSTNRATYSYVTADTAITATPRANFPYSFRNRKFKVDSSYRLENKNKITAGVEYGLFNRTYQEIVTSTKTSLWGKYAKKLSSDINYSLKLEGSSRKADNYRVLAEINPIENPQLRKYNLADKDELKAAFNINLLTLKKLFLNINFEYANNDYSNSAVGLKEGKELAAGIDAQYSVNEEMSFTAYLQQSTLSSLQNGSSVAGAANWTADNEDSILTVGLGGDYNVIEDELNLGFNLVHTDATGKVSLTGASATPLPDVISQRDTISIYGNYLYDENMTFKLRYDYETYKEKNWNLDNVTQGTIDNVLNLGETSPDYNIGVIWASMKYLF
jgi:MtrB/PioB family decaheme-associated outer membrane protein